MSNGELDELLGMENTACLVGPLQDVYACHEQCLCTAAYCSVYIASKNALHIRVLALFSLAIANHRFLFFQNLPAKQLVSEGSF